MPSRKPVPKRPPYFRVRCVASLMLAAGVWVGAMVALTERETVPAAGQRLTVVPVTALPPPPAPDPAAPSILIDPGHGGTDPGTVAGGEYEKTWTLKVSAALADELRRRGWTVELTRSTDTFIPLPDRAALANGQPRLAFVSIHFNAGNPDAAGVETYYAWPKNPEVMARVAAASEVPAGMALRDDRGLLLAGALQSSICAATGSKDRGPRNDPGLAVLNRTQCPAVLVECGFLTNTAECDAIKTSAWREKLVRGLANGLDAWLRESSAKDFGLVMEQVISVASPPTAAQ